jgi:YbbR domain-containing protein
MNSYDIGIALITIFLSLFIVGILSLVLDSLLFIKSNKESKKINSSIKQDQYRFESDLSEIDYTVEYDNPN